MGKAEIRAELARSNQEVRAIAAALKNALPAMYEESVDTLIKAVERHTELVRKLLADE
jgi:hypothetical protein